MQRWPGAGLRGAVVAGPEFWYPGGLTMRKKNAGALFMDFQISPDDRVGAVPKKRRGKPAGKAKGKAARSSRVEPQFGGSDFAIEDERPVRGKPARGKVRKAGGRRQRRPLTLGRVIGKLVYWLLILGVWGSIAVAGIVVYFAVQLPASDTWAVPDRPANIRVVASNGQLLSNRGKTGGEAVALRDLPHYVPAAVLAIEDKRFYQHFGVAPIGVLGAIRITLSEGRGPLTGHGGSTVTQQLAKNLFLTPDQTRGRKIQEAVLAIWLEQNYTK